ncbi:MAG: energy-coupling factor transporter transmembrane protein EcfT [Bacilli bacterium]|nr:energy-coupling factor transporter transmembrane protein EcfT [Bacilli bacterium]
MYSRNSFGSYYPVDSTIHRLNPVIKLINFIIVCLLLILTNSVYINSFIFILVIVMMLLSFVPFKYYFNTFYSLRYVYILIAFICAYFDKTLTLSLVYMMKLISVVEYLNILAYTTSPSESIYGIEKFLSFFNFLYLPVSKIAFKINSFLRFFPLYFGTFNKALKASASRGVDYTDYNILKRIVLFFSINKNVLYLTRRKNKEIKTCSELRLYDIKQYRTNYRTNKLGFYDIFFLLFHLLLVLSYMVDGGLI